MPARKQVCHQVAASRMLNRCLLTCCLSHQVWASDEIAVYCGKTELADERYAKHIGRLLTPPVGDAQRIADFGPLVPTDVKVDV